MIASIIEAVLGGLFGVKQPTTRDEKKMRGIAIILVFLVLALLVLFGGSSDNTAQRYCSQNRLPEETMGECAERIEKYEYRLATIDAIDKESLSACSANYKSDPEKVWDCVKLTDGRPLNSVYRRPGEGD
ncbi:TPA: hypothetical protein L4F23_005924 [Pseudomonas aeruginosa]|nr:hypothetical protein [Pseudomonas aeruginosa]HCL3992808.1 hypothetical protein [Pseudomonas aeruginosa]